MPRVRRQKGDTGVYHVMVRGVNKADIFFDDADRNRYLDTLMRFKRSGSYELYAYCLMSNHVHLLIRGLNDTVSSVMKRVGVSYVYYLNEKYDRVGHLYQDRYRSEPVDTDQYFMSCSRYIHNNPVDAGLVENPESYPWSSFRFYTGEVDMRGLLSTDNLLDFFGSGKEEAFKGLQEFTRQRGTDKFIEYSNERSDVKVHRAAFPEILKELLRQHSVTFDYLSTGEDMEKKRTILREIRRRSNLSVRELSRMLGISKDIIFRA